MHNDKKAYQVDRTPTELLSDLLVQLKFLRQECLHYLSLIHISEPTRH